MWLYPTGWADVGYSPSEVAVKEVQEETGIQCDVIRPIGIYDGLRLGFSRIPLYTIVFLCRATGGELRHHPQECLDVGWFSEHELPQPIANFDKWGARAFASIRGESGDTDFDLPRQPVWRGSHGH
ncbi:MAG: NUDIX domain-containing protein [Acidimicrobiales bacterium]